MQRADPVERDAQRRALVVGEHDRHHGREQSERCKRSVQPHQVAEHAAHRCAVGRRWLLASRDRGPEVGREATPPLEHALSLFERVWQQHERSQRDRELEHPEARIEGRQLRSERLAWQRRVDGAPIRLDARVERSAHAERRKV